MALIDCVDVITKRMVWLCSLTAMTVFCVMVTVTLIIWNKRYKTENKSLYADLCKKVEGNVICVRNNVKCYVDIGRVYKYSFNINNIQCVEVQDETSK